MVQSRAQIDARKLVNLAYFQRESNKLAQKEAVKLSLSRGRRIDKEDHCFVPSGKGEIVKRADNALKRPLIIPKGIVKAARQISEAAQVSLGSVLVAIRADSRAQAKS